MVEGGWKITAKSIGEMNPFPDTTWNTKNNGKNKKNVKINKYVYGIWLIFEKLLSEFY